ncbi:hypothetical protein H0X06_06275 [Candidatus Dependentiae bacterium]|nr:hypothetical protein [Candidatus Dependentiae bacterium]
MQKCIFLSLTSACLLHFSFTYSTLDARLVKSLENVDSKQTEQVLKENCLTNHKSKKQLLQSLDKTVKDDEVVLQNSSTPISLLFSAAFASLAFYSFYKGLPKVFRRLSKGKSPIPYKAKPGRTKKSYYPIEAFYTFIGGISLGYCLKNLYKFSTSIGDSKGKTSAIEELVDRNES